MTLLEVKDASISFGGLKAVDGFSLSLPEGSLQGLIGPNGAGKTTVFNLLTGVYQADGGSIALGGRSLRGMRPYQIAAAGVARTFQNIRLFGNLSVLDNVRIASHCRSRGTLAGAVLRDAGSIGEERAIEERAHQLLEIFGLDTRAEEQAKNLPYGDQRRLEIARALSTSPAVLLLDEPAAGMNPHEKLALKALVQQVRKDFAVTILLIEHDMGVVMDISDRVVVLDYGRKIGDGSPDEVRANPDVISAYLGTVH